MLDKHVILPEGAPVQKHINTLSGCQLALFDTMDDKQCPTPVKGLTVLCCFSILFSPPPFKALLLFSSKVAAALRENPRLHPFGRRVNGLKNLQELCRDIFSCWGQRSRMGVASNFRDGKLKTNTLKTERLLEKLGLWRESSAENL